VAERTELDQLIDTWFDDHFASLQRLHGGQYGVILSAVQNLKQRLEGRAIEQPAVAAVAEQKKRGGNPGKYDWQAFDDEVVFIADIDNLPLAQAELEQRMTEFMTDLHGTAPHESQIRKRISRLYQALEPKRSRPGRT
jgi:hypothetical protein